MQAAGTPYPSGIQLGHVPDTALSGSAIPPAGWLAMRGRSNNLMGGVLGPRVGQHIDGFTVNSKRTMIWDKITKTTGVVCFEPPATASVEALPVRLPPAHMDLLRLTDGLHSGLGYLRIFGVGTQVRDQIWWNDAECWRFAWPSHCDGFWFFAEQADGAQYAYEIHGDGNVGDRVVYFDPITMTPRWTLPSFDVFVENTVIKLAAQPLKPYFALAVKRFGFVPPSKHIVPVPHVTLGGEFAGDNLMLVEARVAMIMNADLWAEINRVGNTDGDSRIETYLDAKGRNRFRIRSTSAYGQISGRGGRNPINDHTRPSGSVRALPAGQLIRRHTHDWTHEFIGNRIEERHRCAIGRGGWTHAGVEPALCGVAVVELRSPPSRSLHNAEPRAAGLRRMASLGTG